MLGQMHVQMALPGERLLAISTGPPRYIVRLPVSIELHFTRPRAPAQVADVIFRHDDIAVAAQMLREHFFVDSAETAGLAGEEKPSAGGFQVVMLP